ncbi:RHS repeat protein [Acidobacteria bacterium ACD]|nr:RHS repeat protein [Acidobacteria bacterium ACD]
MPRPRAHVGLFALLLMTTTLPSAAGDVWQPEETLPGFKANQAYDSLGVDNVNLFSGDPTIAIPLGPSYPLGGKVTWQLTAHYSSKFWHMSSEHCETPGGSMEPRDVALLAGRPSLGPGWALELGEIVHNVESGYYRYDSPDGGRHQFRLRTVADPSGASVTEWMTEDASDLRMVDCSAAEGVFCREIQFPDGTRRRFARFFEANPLPPSPRLYHDFYYRFGTGASLVEDERPRLGLSAIYDEFGNRVLSVDPGAGAFPAAVVLRPHDSRRRAEVQLSWTSFPVVGQLGTVSWPVLERITFPTAAASRLLVTFQREPRVLTRPGRSCTLAPDVPVPFLTSIRQVAENAQAEVLSEHAFVYRTGEPAELEGVLSQLTLPTRARVEYRYGTTHETFACEIASGAPHSTDAIAIWDDDDPEEIRSFQTFSDRSASVVERLVYQPGPAGGESLLSATRYVRQNAFCRIPQDNDLPNIIVPHRQVVRTDHEGDPAGAPAVTKEEYLYTVEVLSPPGLEVRRRSYRPDRDPSSGTWTFSDRPVRVTVNCWEGREADGARTTSCGTVQPPGGGSSTYEFQSDVRQQKTVTWYGDLPVRADGSYSVEGSDCSQATTPCLQTASTGYSDVTRRASQEVVTGNGAFPSRVGWLGRTTTTSWTRISVADPWIFDRHSERTVADAWTPGCPGTSCHVPAWPPSPASYTVRQEWDAVRPAFLRRVERSDPTYGRLLRDYEPDADGNPVTETASGDGPGIDGTRTYVLRRAFAGGLLTRTRFDGLDWDRYHVDRDPGTGAVVASEDPNGLRTTYSYDVLGRLTKTTPPAGGTPTRFCYRPSSTAGPYVLLKRNPETTDGTACSLVETGASGVIEAYLYDGIGRLRREIRRVPLPTGVSDLAVRETTWDAAGRTTWRSEWTSCPVSADIAACFTATLAAPGTAFSRFDERGRPRTVVGPDRTAATYSYDDGKVLGSDFYEDVSEEVSPPGAYPLERADRRSRKDPFGVLIGAHAPGKNRYGHLAFYEADVLGNVSWVRDYGLLAQEPAALTATATDPVQLRRFEHDALGLLRREAHPEKAIETVYTLYDPLGNVVEKLEREGASGPVRATHRFEYDPGGRLIRSTANGQVLLENVYDLPAIDGLNAGKSRGNLVRRTGHNPGAVSSAAVVDHFLFDEAGGRLSERRTTVGLAGPVFRQRMTYNSLGLPETVRRIRPDGTSELATTTYSAGLPTSLLVGESQGIVMQARYSPFGSVASLYLWRVAAGE